MPEGDVGHGWLRRGDRALAVAVHEAAAPARGDTVVIAAPPGRERVTTHRTLLHVARALAADGWRVVRFDWSGTGGSPVPGDPTADDAPAQLWAEDLEAVRAWAAQAGPVHGLGIRLGGSLLAASEGEWASRHIWSAVSGKRWLRRHGALRRMAGSDLPEREKSGTELMDLHLDPEAAAALKQLPEPVADPARHVSVLEGPAVEALPVDVHPRLANVPPEAAAAVVSALAAEAGPRPGGPTTSRDVPLRPEPVVELPVGDTAVRLRRTRVGGGRRPAVLVEPLDPRSDAPGIAFVSLGSEPMDAPGSLWTRTAVAAAARGAVCLLAERTDTGELVRPGQAQDANPYAHFTLVETREVVEHLARLTDGPLQAAGVCLGAWGLIATAHRLPEDITRRLTLHVVNNIGWRRAPWRYWRQGLRRGPLAPMASSETPAEQPAAETPTPRAGGLATSARTAVRAVRRRALEGSPRVQALAAALGILEVPEPLVQQLAGVPGLHLDLVFGPMDSEHFHVVPGPIGPGCTVTVLDPLDHSLHATASRRNLLEHLLANLPQPSPDAH